MSDLFVPYIPSDNKEYLALRDDLFWRVSKQLCEKMWKKFEPYADSTFRDEFAQQVHSRF
jgi:hypothetical protein